MPRTSKTDAPITLDLPVIEGRYVELDGYTVGSRPTRPTSTPHHCSAACPMIAARARTGAS